MSNHKPKTIETPAFDALAGQSSPFGGFGQILPNFAQLENQFLKEAADAQHRVQEGFRIKLAGRGEIPNELDKIIANMWNSGWNPESGNINLFTRDFGCVLTKAILDLLGGRLIFRSKEDVSHLSIFWANAKLEAFPFHKVLKCIHNRQGETMTNFIDGLASKLKSMQRHTLEE